MLGERAARTRVGREDDRLGEPSQPGDDPPRAARAARSPRGGRSRRRTRRPSPSSARMRERSRARGANRATRRPSRRRRPGSRPSTPSSRELARERSSGANRRAASAVDLDPVSLLGHRQVAAAQPCLDVGDGHAAPPRRARPRASSSCPRRRAPLGRLCRRSHPRSAGLDRRNVGRPQVERHGGLARAELLEEHRRERGVPVLARVHDDLLDPRRAERDRERRRLDELRPVADDGQQPHGSRRGAVGERSPTT